MSAAKAPLGEFEQRLLTELRQVVAECATTSSGGRRVHRSNGYRLRLAVASVAAVFVVAASAVVGLPMVRSASAFAVTAGQDGKLTVRINELRDADGLESQLEHHGVRATVDYPPSGTACRDGRFRPSPTEFNLTMTRDGDAFVFTFDPRALRPDDTLVIITSGGAHAGGIAVTLARGQVRACVPVPVPPAASTVTVSDGVGPDGH